MSHARLEPASRRYTGPVIAGLVIGLIIAAILLPVDADTPSVVAWPVFLAEWATPAVVILAAMALSRRLRRTRQVFGVACFLVAVALMTGEIAFVVSQRVPDHKRCVQSGSLVVVPSSECADTAGGPAGPKSGPVIWYYGGTGYRVGTTASDGSVTAPSDGVFGGGFSGGDGGDGGDGGGDGGGGDGGGGGGD
jgi:uncharacterized membrane protein YgcG